MWMNTWKFQNEFEEWEGVAGARAGDLAWECSGQSLWQRLWQRLMSGGGVVR
jgi:hypothetical protein